MTIEAALETASTRYHKPVTSETREDVLRWLYDPENTRATGTARALRADFLTGTWAEEISWHHDPNLPGADADGILALLHDMRGAQTAYTLAQEAATRFVHLLHLGTEAPPPVYLWALPAGLGRGASPLVDRVQDAFERLSRVTMLPAQRRGGTKPIGFSFPMLALALQRHARYDDLLQRGGEEKAPVHVQWEYACVELYARVVRERAYQRARMRASDAAQSGPIDMGVWWPAAVKLPSAESSWELRMVDVDTTPNPFEPVMEILGLGYSLHWCMRDASGPDRLLLAIPPLPLSVAKWSSSMQEAP